MLAKNDGVSAFGTITTIAESPRRPACTTPAPTMAPCRCRGMAGRRGRTLSGELSRVAEEHLRVARCRRRPSTKAPCTRRSTGIATTTTRRYVYASTQLRSNLAIDCRRSARGQTVRCITEDPKNANVLYLGTEFGLFVSLDKGEHWTRMRGGLPTVPVAEITIQPRDNDMLVATHGRSIWILDDLAPIQHAAEALTNGRVAISRPSGDVALRRARRSIALDGRSAVLGTQSAAGRGRLVLPEADGERRSHGRARRHRRAGRRNLWRRDGATRRRHQSRRLGLAASGSAVPALSRRARARADDVFRRSAARTASSCRETIA